MDNIYEANPEAFYEEEYVDAGDYNYNQDGGYDNNQYYDNNNYNYQNDDQQYTS